MKRWFSPTSNTGGQLEIPVASRHGSFRRTKRSMPLIGLSMNDLNILRTLALDAVERSDDPLAVSACVFKR